MVAYARPDGSTVSGSGIQHLVAEKDAELAKKIDANLSTAQQVVAAMPVPFDQAIITDDGRKSVQAAIDSLWVVTRDLPIAAKTIGIETAIEGL